MKNLPLKNLNDSDESEDDSESDSDESEDDSGWDNLINEAYEEYDDVYDVKVQQYEQEGCSKEEAGDKASDDLLLKYQKYVMQMYKNVITAVHDLQDTSLHRQIMNDVDYLHEEKFHDWDQALKLAIRKTRGCFMT